MLRLTFRLFMRYTLLLLLLGGAAIGLFWNHFQLFLDRPLSIPQQGMVLEVAPGDTLRGVASQLQREGVLEDARLLRFYARLYHDASRIKAGEYVLRQGLTPVALLDLLVAGKTRQYALTFTEGWTFRQMRQAMAKHPSLKQTLNGLSDMEVMARLGHPEEHPEGRFFPDTYLFPKNFSDEELLRRAYQRMEQTLAEAWQQRQPGLPLTSPYEALILASIIEKETGSAGERREISGVFIRRLNKGMKLQTDPTVIYGMGERYKGNIRRKDLLRDTAYNTYVHAGLPPTPICMPGRAAILAAVDPAEGKALYFVAKGNGSHQFSATLKQHNAAVRKYQLKR